MKTQLPEHLGGHAGKTHLFPVVVDHLLKTYDIKTMVDVGCGPGGMVELARKKGIETIGIDGDWTVERNIEVIIHDFTTGPYEVEPRDLAWSVEFLEHVHEKYMDNYFSIFEKCKYVLCTAALPGHEGHHHVNCQPHEYWVEKFANYGFTFDAEATETIKALPKNYRGSNKKNWIAGTGKFFINDRQT